MQVFYLLVAIKRKNLTVTLHHGCLLVLCLLPRFQAPHDPDLDFSKGKNSTQTQFLSPLLIWNTIHQLEEVENLYNKSHDILLGIKI